MSMFRQSVFIIVALLLLWPTAGEAQENSPPPLPQGLDAPQSSQLNSSGVPLPEGLGGASQETESGLPSLPDGLVSEDGGAEQDSSEGDQQSGASFFDNPEVLGFPLHGFFELRNGWRVQADPAIRDDASIGEARFQLESERFWGAHGIVWQSDFLYDPVMDELDADFRTLYFSSTPLDFFDLRIGRQILTWGTGDLIFINDLFPKDWQSFFIGRDEEYLKAPADAVKAGIFTDLVNIDFVYVPSFESDIYIRGKRISFWNDSLGRRSGDYDRLSFHTPGDWFDEDEFSYRVYRTVASYEVAFYGYNGYWKSPASVNPFDGAFEFPQLSVYGASIRGGVGPGIGNIETGYYDSSDDSSGDDPLIRNSEFRFLMGYEQEAAKNFTVGVQY
ncbi:hypothetical protein K8I31_05210, partial [bacterium]|nr:hypothetical protein [bacterium]